MLKKIWKRVKGFCGYPLLVENRFAGYTEQEQLKGAKDFRDLLEMARVVGFPVILSVSVNGVECSVLLQRGDDPVVDWLYNFACGSIMCMHESMERAKKEGMLKTWESIRHEPDAKEWP